MVTEGSKPEVSLIPPRTLNVQKFAEARASDLEALYSIVANRASNDLRCHRNKRRRTTGHDDRVGKKRFRKKRKLGVAGGGVGKNNNHNNNNNNSNYNYNNALLEETDEKKIPPRRVRRRNELRKNPQSGFSTSGDGTKRLRTHVWHAKRFMMTKLWGFYLPFGLQGRGRGSRALLKKLKHGVLVHDASYYGVVQLDGPEDLLLSLLNSLVVPAPSAHGDNISLDVLSGVAHGSGLLHHVGAPFSQCVAPITFMWRPQQRTGLEVQGHGTPTSDKQNRDEDSGSSRRLWVWLHPAAFKEGYDVLKSACERQVRLNVTGCSINCIALEDQLARLELMGSETYQLLRKILHPVNLSENPWPVKTCSVARNHGKETRPDHISILVSEDQICDSAVISLTAKDPRSLSNEKVDIIPGSRTHDLVDDNKGETTPAWTSGRDAELLPSHSGFPKCIECWDACQGICPPVEDNVVGMEKHRQRNEFFRIRKKCSAKPHTSSETHFSRLCPVLLLKGINPNSSFTRWSVILPISWVKTFWNILLSSGAHAIGLREKHWIACEVGMPHFPLDFPDCNAYSCFMAKEASGADEKASRRPYSMRPLDVPISPPWNSIQLTVSEKSMRTGDIEVQDEELCSNIVNGNRLEISNCGKCEVSTTNGHMSFEGFVARTSSVLNEFLNGFNGDHLLLFPNVPGRARCMFKLIKDKVLLNQLKGPTSQRYYHRKLCFVRVHLHAYRGGSLEEGAVVCAPTVADIKLFKARSEDNKETLQVPQSSLESYFSKQSSGTWDLQVPEDPSAKESFRWPIGFVTTGFVRGSKKPVAGALCEAVLLAHLRAEQWMALSVKQRRKEIFVLVRNLKSTAYRLALATIILEQYGDDIEYM